MPSSNGIDLEEGDIISDPHSVSEMGGISTDIETKGWESLPISWTSAPTTANLSKKIRHPRSDIPDRSPFTSGSSIPVDCIERTVGPALSSKISPHGRVADRLQLRRNAHRAYRSSRWRELAGSVDSMRSGTALWRRIDFPVAEDLMGPVDGCDVDAIRYAEKGAYSYTKTWNSVLRGRRPAVMNGAHSSSRKDGSMWKVLSKTPFLRH